MSQHQVDLFLQACGMVAPLRLDILYAGDELMQRRLFGQPFVLIGRNASNDVSLTDKRVSKQHAYLQVIDGRLFYFDLGSRTGLRQHGPLRRQGWLDPGQVLWVGPCAIRLPSSRPDSFLLESSPADVPPSAPALDDPFPTLETKAFPYGAVHVGTWQLERLLTFVGAERDCGICLSAPNVSRYHCALLQTGAGLWVVDLLGREGTSVNSSRIRWAGLQEGDRLQIGSHDLAVHYENVSALPRPDAPLGRSALEAGEAKAALPVDRSLTVYRRDADNIRAAEAALMPVIHHFNQMQQQMFEQFHEAMLLMVQTLGTFHHEQMRLVREELDQLHAITRELHALRAEQAAAAARSSLPSPAPSPSGTGQTANGDAVPKGSASDPSPRPAPPSAPAALRPAGQPADDVHTWLTERMAVLEAERQTRWQKLVAAILGK